MIVRSGTGTAVGEWVSMGEASALLGVAPATLRRWADTGEIRTFTTPGGHRRFSRPGLLAMLPAAREARPSLERLGETADRMTRVVRRQVARETAEPPWLADLPAAGREPLRERGRRIAVALISYLDAPAGEREAALRAGEEAAAEYGRGAAAAGASLREAVQMFLSHRRPFVRELAKAARRRALDAGETGGLLDAASDAVDRLLLATLAGFEAGRVSDPPAGRAPRAARP